jgi:tyrosine-protein kinase Etk/Wzc
MQAGSHAVLNKALTKHCMDKSENLIGVLQSLYRWRKPIRNLCLAAAVLSVVLSLFLKNYYKATTIFYPTSPRLANPELIFGYTGQVTDYYGGDRDLDRLAEVANSSELVDFMVARFNLYDHYQIDSSARLGPYKVRKRLLKLYSAQKNKNDALEISVEDKDPQFASAMANAARDKVNGIAQRLNKQSQEKLLAAFEDNMVRKRAELESLADSIRSLQDRYGIFDPSAISSALSSELAVAETGINKTRAKLDVLSSDPDIPKDTITYIRAELKAFEEQKRLLNDPGDESGALSLKKANELIPKLSVLQDMHYQARKQLTFDIERYNQIRSAFNTDIPALLVVEQAEVPLFKSRPRRSIIVIASVLGTFLFAVFGALLTDSIRALDWKNITKE